ncbi:hypothetical protein WMY93_002248 [Mugilogobius chulae]|uniref:Coiled-coil domain-containing protein 135 n=1 Tax=Mugilogobius chulae TaxID=88201 RepID=A0AAW0Q3Z0_9GOBI
METEDHTEDHTKNHNEDYNEDHSEDHNEDHSEDPGHFMRSVDVQPQFPQSYTENTEEEEHLLYIAKSFQRHFYLLYPDRRPLLLCPRNECGLEKLLTTTLRPTLTGQVDLLNWQQCARFVSNYLSLQPLEPPQSFSLRSPQAVLRTQRGTSLEYANLLCSLLLGLDYNAYCVSGYASRQVCELDRSQESYPTLEEAHTDPVKEIQDGNSKYNMMKGKKLQSDFVLKREEKLKQQQSGHKPSEEAAPAPDPLWGLRVHFWVLVMAGSRRVEQDFFIEPLSAKTFFPHKQTHFLGVESVWNELNIYINMQDCANGCQELVWDPEDKTHWEPVVYGTTSKKQLEAQILKRHKIKMGLHVDQDEEAGPEYSFDMPLSWCSMILIVDRDVELCYPQGFKVTHFKDALEENFIPFFCTDGLVTRLTLYQDPDKTQVHTVKERFQNRADQLEERETKGGFTTERFRVFRSDDLISHRFNTTVPEACPAPLDPSVNPEREMCFGPFRVDGLVRRLERGNLMMETFEKRRDFLFERHILFDSTTESNPSEPEYAWEDKTGTRPILKVVEQFHRDPSKAACEDIAERVFLLAERRIEVTYHLEENTFIAAKRSFEKPSESTNTQKAGDFTNDMVSIFQVTPQVYSPKQPQLHKLLLELMKEEQKTVSWIRSAQKEVQSVVQRRAKEQEDPCVWSTTRTGRAQKLREKRLLLGEEMCWMAQQQKDVLAPVLMRLNGTTDLSPDQAQTVYHNCLQDFRERMIQQACLIQERILQNTQAVEERQQREKRFPNRLSDSDPEEFYATMKRQIHVAQKRLEIHQKSAHHRFTVLKHQLCSDPRLGPHLSA